MRMRSDQLGVETGNADDGLQVLWALSAVWAADTDRPWGVANGAQPKWLWLWCAAAVAGAAAHSMELWLKRRPCSTGFGPDGLTRSPRLDGARRAVCRGATARAVARGVGGCDGQSEVRPLGHISACAQWRDYGSRRAPLWCAGRGCGVPGPSDTY